MSSFEIFQPGLEYLRREKDRYKMLVSKPTHGGGAPLGIDLEAGVAKIRIPARAAAAEPVAPATTTAEPELTDPPDGPAPVAQDKPFDPA